MNRSQLLRQYTNIGVKTGVEGASPHRLILLLLDGALSKINMAKNFVERGSLPEFQKNVGLAIDIIEGLRLSLDHERGGEIATNLELLYEYMVKQLLIANIKRDASILAEVNNLLSEIRSGWIAINTGDSSN